MKESNVEALIRIKNKSKRESVGFKGNFPLYFFKELLEKKAPFPHQILEIFRRV